MIAPYQKHSETSREAAQLYENGDNLRAEVLRHIKSCGIEGAICYDIAEIFGIVQGTIAARLIELERDNKIIKTMRQRKTGHNRNAYIYVVPSVWTEEMGRAAAKEQDKTPPKRKWFKFEEWTEQHGKVLWHCAGSDMDPWFGLRFGETWPYMFSLPSQLRFTVIDDLPRG